MTLSPRCVSWLRSDPGYLLEVTTPTQVATVSRTANGSTDLWPIPPRSPHRRQDRLVLSRAVTKREAKSAGRNV
ncbi:hypothetical protein CC2G_012013 [Coprinopsis cinerea AmutBmut pab1-1]|nr:hypothetical protein CC2G_012013 [Coprinopsis cinerea AmutBmut pab1-1]